MFPGKAISDSKIDASQTYLKITCLPRKFVNDKVKETFLTPEAND